MDTTILLLVGAAVVVIGVVAALARVFRPAPAEEPRREPLTDSLMGDPALAGSTGQPSPQVRELPVLNIPDSIKDSVPEGAQMIYGLPEGAKMRPVNPESDPDGLQFIFVPGPEDEESDLIELPIEQWPAPAPNGHSAPRPPAQDA